MAEEKVVVKKPVVYVEEFWDEIDCGEDGCVEIRIWGDTYPIKELLKKHGFKWEPGKAMWIWQAKENDYLTPEDYDRVIAEIEKVAEIREPDLFHIDEEEEEDDEEEDDW